MGYKASWGLILACGNRFRVQAFRNLALSVLKAQLFHVKLRNGIAGMLTRPAAEREMSIIMAARDHMLETVLYICIHIYIYIHTICCICCVYQLSILNAHKSLYEPQACMPRVYTALISSLCYQYTPYITPEMEGILRISDCPTQSQQRPKP